MITALPISPSYDTQALAESPGQRIRHAGHRLARLAARPAQAVGGGEDQAVHDQVSVLHWPPPLPFLPPPALPSSDIRLSDGTKLISRYTTSAIMSVRLSMSTSLRSAAEASRSQRSLPRSVGTGRGSSGASRPAPSPQPG